LTITSLAPLLGGIKWLNLGGGHHITRADQHVILELDAEPALDVLLRELNISLDDPQRAIAVVLAGFLFPGAAEVLRSIRARRVNRHTVYAVTNQRILKIAIWPRLEVDAWEASAVTEVSRRARGLVC
jgi:hypothetical protein